MCLVFKSSIMIQFWALVLCFLSCPLFLSTLPFLFYHHCLFQLPFPSSHSYPLSICFVHGVSRSFWVTGIMSDLSLSLFLLSSILSCCNCTYSVIQCHYWKPCWYIHVLSVFTVVNVFSIFYKLVHHYYYSSSFHGYSIYYCLFISEWPVWPYFLADLTSCSWPSTNNAFFSAIANVYLSLWLPVCLQLISM